MESHGPKFHHWIDLDLVAKNADLVVSDASADERMVPGGLFGRTNVERELPINAGKLFIQLNPHFKSMLDFAGDAEKLVALMPGIDLLGPTREVRISRLLERLPELPAYRWLQNRSGYRTSLEKLNGKARTGPPRHNKLKAQTSIGQAAVSHAIWRQGYGSDIRELTLLAAIVNPLSAYLLYSELRSHPQFPTREEIQEASDHAKSLLSFLKQSFAVHEVVTIPFRFEDDLRHVMDTLRSVAPGYTKPRLDATFNERRYLDQVIRNCGLAFGECSPTLMRALIEIIDFNYDEASLKRKTAAWRRDDTRL